MNTSIFLSSSLENHGDAKSTKKNTPPLEIPEREEGEEYISIKDDPKKIDVPRS
jgi:hypothetical protein